MKSDAKLRDSSSGLGHASCTPAAPRDPFVTLCTSIASQQLSIKAAATIFRRFEDLFRRTAKPTPHRVMTLTDDEIRACGFSRPKVSFIKDLAGHVLDGRLDLKGLKKHPMTK
jgi:3-methyladenine DNA glycosylase/8-oxoguanine DNA glycosylase